MSEHKNKLNDIIFESYTTAEKRFDLVLLLCILIVCFSCESSQGYIQASKGSGLYVKWTFYHSNGNVKKVETFLDSKKDGNWMTYDINGKLIKKEIYLKGELESEKSF